MLKSSIVIGLGGLFIVYLGYWINLKNKSITTANDGASCQAVHQAKNGRINADYLPELLDNNCRTSNIAIVLERHQADARIMVFK